jgi:alpha-glucosidase
MQQNDLSWWQEAVFYHIYLRSFADSNGNGLGDLPGLTSRLDHLKGTERSLGVDALWLSPFYPSPDKDFGYDVADYCDIDSRYGTLKDLDALIVEAHKRGIKIMIDLVLNHTSDQHPWFRESRNSRDNPKRNWYIWRDPQPGKRYPNNWHSVFGGRAWEWDKTSGQFYYHMFLEEQPDLNWRNPEVQEALMDVVRFWLERGVDGFRLDVFNLWFKHQELPDNPPRMGLRGFERQEHLYDVDQPDMHTVLSRFRKILDSYGDRTSIGEFFGSDSEIAASYCDKDQLHMVFDFNFAHCPWKPAPFQDAIFNLEALFGDVGWPSYCLSNHDNLCRHISRYGGNHPDEIAKVAAAMLLTLRGTPFLYYGEEIGMPNVPLRRNQMVDPLSRRYWPLFSRDPGRAPMQWNGNANAGFTTGKPWLPIHPAYPSRNVESQSSDPHSVFSFYRSLIQLRRATLALRRGRFISLQSKPKAGLAYLRSLGTAHALVGLNFTGKPAIIRFDKDLPTERWSLALSSDPSSTSKVTPNSITLGPFEAAIFMAE